VRFFGEEKGVRVIRSRKRKEGFFCCAWSCILSASVSRHSFSYQQVFFPTRFSLQRF